VTLDDSDELVCERRGPVSVVRLNRPEARNALTPALVDALGAAIVDADADPEVRAVVLTGTGTRAFCTGMDLRSFAGAARAVPRRGRHVHRAAGPARRRPGDGAHRRDDRRRAGL
jgi:enoyl-CoA hydratase/carnithine racemase